MTRPWPAAARRRLPITQSEARDGFAGQAEPRGGSGRCYGCEDPARADPRLTAGRFRGADSAQRRQRDQKDQKAGGIRRNGVSAAECLHQPPGQAWRDDGRELRAASEFRVPFGEVLSPR